MVAAASYWVVLLALAHRACWLSAVALLAHSGQGCSGHGRGCDRFGSFRQRLRYLDDVFGGTFKNAYATKAITAELAAQADLIIGAVLVPGAAAPKLITRAQLSDLKPGAALVDVAIDQGGCFETSRATTHQDPIYEVDGIMHYCVANMPGAVARTSTQALATRHCHSSSHWPTKVASGVQMMRIC